MRVAIFIILVFSACQYPVLAQPSEYDYRQDDIFNNYRGADSELARQIEGRLSAIESKFNISLLAVGALITGLLIPWVRKKYLASVLL